MENPTTGERSSFRPTPHPGADTPDVPPAARGVPWLKILLVLLLIHSMVVGFSLVSPLFTGQPRGQTAFSVYFDVNYEGNFPTWWSVVQLSVTMAVLGLTAVLARRQQNSTWVAWLTLAVLVLLLNVDEGTWLHERFDQLALQFVDVQDFTFVWLVFGIPLALGVLAVAALSARNLPRASAMLILGGFAALFLAAVGLELLAGEMIRRGTGTGLLAVTYHLEEFLELAAVALILAAPLAAYRVRLLPQSICLTLQTVQRSTDRPGNHSQNRLA